ncbi:Peroxisomal targeting signal type 2 receptor [Phaffia rhodozyma]|uniref:Peroxin-7 n=1 Tax=Phaffia rhodozyma TaxID=264483 RepID=A0A0F7SPL9_PHARH|nr:Peroxisomal targeting signal type 2 receptor [Phaffia rhodozyma]
MMPLQPLLQIPGYSNFGIAWSPFIPNRLALASSANFGLVGNGRLHILSSLGPLGKVQIDQYYDNKDSIFDLAWSELNQNQLVTAGGDGNIKLYDLNLQDFPIKNFHEHSREVMSIDWSNLNKEIFASCSWDGSIKLWSPDRQTSLVTILAHQACVYATQFSPHSPNLLGSSSEDGTFKLWDLRLPDTRTSGTISGSGGARAVVEIRCMNGGEVLSFDWNKYKEGIIATTLTDSSIQTYDLRANRLSAPTSTVIPSNVGPTSLPVHRLEGHVYPAKKVAWSPWRADVLASGGYDMTTRVWSTIRPSPTFLVATQSAHTEFVAGLAWSLFEEGILMTCGWDGRVCPWKPV